MTLDLILSFLFFLIIFSFSIINPIIISLVVIFFALLVNMFLLTFCNSWLVYSLMIMFLGGMMVIFIYTSSLVSSEKFFSSKGLLFWFFLFLTLNWFSSKDTIYKDKPLFYLSKELKLVFDYYGCENLIILTLILLLTMLMVVKMVQVYKGPLKWKS